MTQPTPPTAIEILNTIGYEGFVKSLYNRSGDISKDFTHAILGIVTESYEYLMATDMANAIEEAGDLAFYLTALSQVLEDFAPIDSALFDQVAAKAAARMSLLNPRADLIAYAVRQLDTAKRWVGYGKAPAQSTTELLAEASVLVSAVIEEGRARDVLMAQVLMVNVEKLLKRYNGITFSAERAVHRDLPAERAVIEASMQ